MSEQQDDYDTDVDKTFASAPWRAERLVREDKIDGSAAVWASDGDLVASVHPGIGGTRIERGIDRARLIAAAGTAAQEAREMGYDPQKAVEALPKLLSLLEEASNALQNDCYGWVALEHEVKDALASAEGSGDE